MRLTVQAKVLLVVVGILVILPLAMVWIVGRQTSELVQAQDRQALATAAVVFEKTLEIRERNLLARYRNVVIEPSFKAAVTQTQRDAATMAAYLRSLFEQPDEEGDAFLFYQSKNELLASVRREGSFAMDAFAQVAAPLVASAYEGEAGVITASWRGRAYTVIAMPVSYGRNSPVVGVLVSGVRIGDSALHEFRILSGAEVVMVAGDTMIASTLPAIDDAKSWLETVAPSVIGHPHEIAPVIVGTEHFHALNITIESGSPTGRLRYMLLASYERSVRALSDTRQTLFAMSLAGILISFIIVWILVGRITQPLRELRNSAEAVGRGDFTRRIVRFTDDECGDLAVAFNGMTTSLQNSHSELRKAVDTLKSTQSQLIQSEKLSAVGQFVAGVAHELNNPLTTVIGFADLLSGTETNEKNRRHMELIAKSAHRCHKIVHSLLSFARQQVPERRLVKINNLIDEVLEIMAYDLRTSSITIVRELGLNLPEILVDPHQIQQVFVNILGNARQALENFRRDGEIIIRSHQMGSVVLIEFKDNGPGIRADNLSRVFDPFFTTKPQGKGTGLGLSLSYGIIQEHGGKITVQSEAGHGAEFTIMLPVPTQTDSVVRVVSAQTRSETPWASTKGKTVLVVDDEEWIIQLAEELLLREGYAVETASSGAKALDLIAARKFDVVVSDWKMPGLNGMHLYEQLSKTDPATAERLIFMSGDVINDTFQGFLSQRAKTCLSKPFDIGDFRRAVDRVACLSR